MAATTAIGMAMPIAAASIVSVGLFAWMWRYDQYERAGAKSPWYSQVSIFVAPSIYGLFAYFFRHTVPNTYFELFGAAMLANCLAMVFLIALSSAAWGSRGKPNRQRAFPILAAFGIAVLILSGAFTS
ncbi:hypothetical protein [Methylobacterium sp. SyP6R]|uniref:hypothetical protein n=1 Tax=Methylobacterium sp. SyP6R TaxID=2718876 RepID=UPI001F1DE890|nr:hypothetical protein [Methylobacterium sp. SyP6R]MCF4123839.1 hypothetical protein [Methylobacterium sp. SyP6R]